MDYQITLSPLARRDLKGIIGYISLDSPLAAERFAAFLHSKTNILRTHPEIGRIFPEIGDRVIREIIVKNYRVIYRIDFLNKQIEIIRCWHGARGIPDLYE